MKKEIREVDQERGILQITTVDERFYARSVKNAESGLPCYGLGMLDSGKHVTARVVRGERQHVRISAYIRAWQ